MTQYGQNPGAIGEMNTMGSSVSLPVLHTRPDPVAIRLSTTQTNAGSQLQCDGSADFYEQLVHAASLAPSPDNNQPWRFSVQDGKLLIHPDPMRNLPSDIDGMFMMVALGAAAENARIAASHQGSETRIRLKSSHYSHTASCVELSFSAAAEPDPLYPQLERRCTCRRWYSRRQVASVTLQALSAVGHDFDGVQTHLITDRSTIRQLSWLIASCDRIRLEYQPFHGELYKQLRFTQDQVTSTRDGLDLKTLELPPGGATLLHWLRRWNRMQIGNRFGLSRLLSLPSAWAAIHSGALAAITVSERSAQQYLEGGRAFQRLWLEAQHHSLSVQPLGSLPIFTSHSDARRGELSKPDQQHIRKVRQRLTELVPTVAELPVVMLFRLGYSQPPLHRSLRRRLQVELTSEIPS